MGVEQLDLPAKIPQLQSHRVITNLMYLIWQSRKDLQLAFDLKTSAGQELFLNWYNASVLREYGLDPKKTENMREDNTVINNEHSLKQNIIKIENQLRRLGIHLPTTIRNFGKSSWLYMRAIIARRQGVKSTGFFNADNNFQKMPKAISGKLGANLIGYAHAELGMGEHVRMTAAAVANEELAFGVLNFDIGVCSRKRANLEHGNLSEGNPYRANIFHINADQMFLAYCHLGRDFFSQRYNIGYWAWELARCPDEWVPVIGMVDEIWAPSRFIQCAFSEKTEKPVKYMPLCVTLPKFAKRTRSYFNLPENRFLFVFAFDFLSYIDRKNPYAVIEAFQMAFKNRSEKVGLVIKVMHGNKDNPQWVDMMKLIAGDPRVHLFNKTMDRNDVLALFDACDCFVSLHRSEGFGRGPAEAMCLGKPVIVTGYSGNMDFTNKENSCLIDYQLVPVQPGQYVFESNQHWADPDVDHAAWHMRRLVSMSGLATELGVKGREYIIQNFGPSVIGRRYVERLRHLELA